jgi:Tol biopolymer transport system component
MIKQSVLVLAGLWLLAITPASSAINLEILQNQAGIRLFWPTNAQSFTLESTRALGSSWSAATNAVQQEGGSNSVITPAAESTRFFRLHAASGAAPTLDRVSASTSVNFANAGTVVLEFTDPATNVVSLMITRSNSIGVLTRTLPAALVHWSDSNGKIVLGYGQEQLAFGENHFAVQLVDGAGRISAPQEFSTTLTGDGSGTPPVISSFAPEISQWSRPRGMFDHGSPRFALNFTDPDGDIARFHVRITAPDGTIKVIEEGAETFGIGGTSGSSSHPILRFDRSSPLGTYSLEATLIDRGGRSSTIATTSLKLVESDPARPPLAISSFAPATGADGTALTILGSGFDTNSLTANQVTIATEGAEVLEVHSDQLKVVVPQVRGSGRIRVQSGDSVAISDDLFLVPPGITISPDSPDAVVGASVQFVAETTAAAPNQVQWSVEEANGESGAITSAGLYTAPKTIPGSGVATVRASFGSNVTAQTRVRVVPPLPTPGATVVLASAGGTAWSVDGRASVSVPAGALSADARVSASILRGAAQPPAGRRVLGAVEFGPSGTVFSQPVTVTIPLVRSYAPETRLSLRFYDPVLKKYSDEQVVATVTRNGDQASAQISHFSIAVIEDAAPASPPSSAPTINSIRTADGAATLLEGSKVPVLMTGSELTDDLTPEIRTAAGGTTDDITPGTLFVKLSSAALVLDVHAIRGFDSGTRDYELRLVRPNGSFARTTFTVAGLPELDVAAGTTLATSGTNFYSEGNIHGRLQVLSPADLSGVFRLKVVGGLMVDGRVDGQGAKGGDGDGQAGGGAGTEGGRGGQGRDDAACFGLGPFDVPSSDDCAGDENHGGNGNLFGMASDFGLRGSALFGYGGLNGFNNDLTERLRQAIEDGISCIGSLGADTLSCVSLGSDVYELADDVLGLEDGAPNGHKGLRGAPLAEHGGGGGGGGGRLEIAGIGPFSANINGGGGGAGGEGGHNVTIVAGGRIDVPGVITSAGGDGGNGASTSELSVSVPFFNVGTGVSIDTGFSGGGGGAGSGGNLEISSGDGIFLPATRAGHIIAGGGKGGSGGVIVTEKEGQHFQFTFRSSHAEDGLGRAPDLNGPRFDPAVLGNLVTEHAYFHLHGVNFASTLRPAKIEVHGENPGDLRTFFPIVGADGKEDVTLLLFPGFNSIRVSDEDLLNKTIYVIAQDTDGDGLTDADEADLGTDPARADTDGDGVSDGAEVLAGTDPNSPDSDGDGLPDRGEAAAHTLPNNPDTDSDGYFDSLEVFLGSDATSALSIPTDIADGTLFADSSALAGPAFLTLLKTNGNSVGLVGQPNGGLKFDIAFDRSGLLYFSRLTSLGQYSPLARVSTPVGDFHTTDGTAIFVTELAYNPADDSLYGQERGPGPDFVQTGQLLRINPANALVTRIGAPTEAIHAMAFDAAGRLWAALGGSSDSDRLVEIDPATGTIKREIGEIGFAPITGLAFDLSGRLFAAQFLSNNESRLLNLDLASGHGVESARPPRAVFSIAFMPPRGNSALVSINRTNTATGNGASLNPVVSADGRFVAFESAATDLVAVPDANSASDAFIRNLQTGHTELISVNAAGTETAGVDLAFSGGFGAAPIAMNHDGRFVLFLGMGTNLTAAGATGFQIEVYLRDRQSGTTVGISDGLGFPGLGFGSGAISADGQTVVFTSLRQGVYLWKAGQGAARAVAPRSLTPVLLTPDSHYLVFGSNDTNLIGFPSTNQVQSLYRMDLTTQTTELVTVSASGTETGNGIANGASISDDGRFIAFQSFANNLSSMPDTNNNEDVFVRDMQTHQTKVVSIGLNGLPAGSVNARFPQIAAGGRYVVFISNATNLVAGLADTNNFSDAFVRDLQAGTTTAVSIDNSGRLLKASNAVISADGQRIAFLSNVIYLRDQATGKTIALDQGQLPLIMNSDGTVIAFTSPLTTITRIPDHNNAVDVFARQVPR